MPFFTCIKLVTHVLACACVITLIIWRRLGKKVQKWEKMVQTEKNFCLLCSISQEPYILRFSFMVQICKMIISPSIFFYFFQNFGFVSRGVKGQKIVQNDKKICLLYSISQESCILWLSFVIQECKMISLSVFFIYSKFWFFGLLVG